MELDFSAITGAISSTAIVAAIGAAAVVKFAPTFVKWGYNKVISFFGS